MGSSQAFLDDCNRQELFDGSLRNEIAAAIYDCEEERDNQDRPRWQDLSAARKEPWLKDADRVLAVLARDAFGWQPIETAPKDGTHVWLARAGRACAVDGRWSGERWMNIFGEALDDKGIVDNTPTHWQPFCVPSPPETGG